MLHTFGDSITADEVVAAFGAQVQGRVFLITGPTPKGLGEAAVLSLACGHPSTIILVGRNHAKYEPVAAAKIVAENEKIDVLINNAGAVYQTLEKSVDGIELTFAACHVGHFLLTNMLVRLLRKSDAPRVVNLTSEAFNLSSGDYENYNFENKEYNWNAAYVLAKLANVHFTKYLAENGRGILAFVVHPGIIWGTSFTDEDEVTKLKGFAKSYNFREKTLEEGAATTLVAALDPALKDQNGAFLADCQVKPLQSPASQQADLPEKLWRLSETLVSETFAL